MSNDTTNADLAALIGSRICHDLISPIGAITNGLELLTMSGGPSGPEMELIADSAGNAGARIGFFRIAYGATGTQMMSQFEISTILDALTAGTRMLTDWQPADPQPRRDVRLAFLALQCCESALPYGGTVTIARDDSGWSITGQGDTINADEALWSALSPESSAAPQVTAATVQFALLAQHARAETRNLRAEVTQGSVTIRF